MQALEVAAEQSREHSRVKRSEKVECQAAKASDDGKQSEAEFRERGDLSRQLVKCASA